MGNGQSTQYPNCKCSTYARSGAYHHEKSRCVSLDGHNCICTIEYKQNSLFCTKIGNIKYCKAEKHQCACIMSKECKASDHQCVCSKKGGERCKYNGDHPCVCSEWSNCKYDGNHLCICSKNKSCKASDHQCVCDSKGPLHCKYDGIHPCTCLKNYEVCNREKNLGHCKASEGHPCLCKLDGVDKSKCQACY